MSTDSGSIQASVELKHQNVSAVLDGLGLPFIAGYKPRGNSQLLLRKEVQRFVLDHADLVQQIVDALEEDRTPGEARFKAIVVDPPEMREVAKLEAGHRLYLPRKIDFAFRDERNRRLGREGEQWVLEFEQHRLHEAGLSDLYERVEWVSDRLGDGAGYDILSVESRTQRRCIEVKTTNGPYTSSFIVSRNELDFSQEAGEEFFLYRLFDFRRTPSLYMLRGDIAQHAHLEPLDYRASFRKLAS